MASCCEGHGREIGAMISTPMDPLKLIVCGYEKSGTTLVNEILRRHPHFDSGFECGFLLADTPQQFNTVQPYYRYFKKCWELSKADMAYIFDAPGWPECYRRTRERSPVIINKDTAMFDKTPIYMLHLSEVLAKVPNIPCVVTVRDPRALFYSWARWSGHQDDSEQWVHDNLPQYFERYSSYAQGYENALDQYADRITLIQFEALCNDPEYYCRRIFESVGLEFKAEFMSFSSKFFVYGNTVSRDYIYSYRDYLSDGLCDTILQGLQEYSDWWFSE